MVSFIGDIYIVNQLISYKLSILLYECALQRSQLEVRDILKIHKVVILIICLLVARLHVPIMAVLLPKKTYSKATIGNETRIVQYIICSKIILSIMKILEPLQAKRLTKYCLRASSYK